MASIINASTTSTSGLVQTADASGVLQLQSNGVTGLTLHANANVTINGTMFVSNNVVQPLVSETSRTTTSNTSVDFTGIPSWVKRITIMYNGVSLSGTAHLLVQIGVGSTPNTSGYSSISSYALVNTSGTGGVTSTSGFIMNAATATYAMSGHMVITNITGNNWVCSGIISNSTTTAFTAQMAGQVSLAGVLGMVRITTSNGTDTFDAGSVNILYE